MCMYVCVCVYIYIYIHTYIHIYPKVANTIWSEYELQIRNGWIATIQSSKYNHYEYDSFEANANTWRTAPASRTSPGLCSVLVEWANNHLKYE